MRLIKMTIIDQILISANKLANEGKKPTVALVKAKLSSPAPLPTIINVLKTWQHDENFIGLVEDQEKNEGNIEKFSENDKLIYCTKDDLNTLQQKIIEKLTFEMTIVKKELADIKQLLTSN